MEGQRKAAEVVVQVGAARAAKTERAGDGARLVAVRAEVPGERLEPVEREPAGATAFAEGREDRIVATKAGHRAIVSLLGEVCCGAGLEEG